MPVYKPFSQSSVWELQKQYYQQLNIAQSWGQNDIPFFATSNPFIADKYARYILDYIERTPEVSLSQPLYIVETGVGHGRFSFLLLERLCQNFMRMPESNSEASHLGKISLEKTTLGEEATIKQFEDSPNLSLAETVHCPFRYIMTDVSENNLTTWKQHPRLQTYIQYGIVDFAYFDVVSLEEPYLELVGTDLSLHLRDKPLLVISNFMLCALPYDLFRISEGHLEHCEIIDIDQEDNPDRNDPKAYLRQLKFQFNYQAIDGHFYTEPLFNQLLQQYSQLIQSATFTFPISVIRLFDYFYRINPEFNWIITDEALSHSSQVEKSHAIVGKIKNGTFSNRVNLHLLELYLQQVNKTVRTPKNPDKRTDTYLIRSTHAQQGFSSLHSSEQNILFADFRAKSYFQLINSFEKSAQPLNIDGVLSLFELSHYDPSLVPIYYHFLLEQASDLKRFQKQQLQVILQECWKHYYDLGEHFDIAFSLGRLMRRLDHPELAIPLLQHSLARTDKSSQNYRCWYLLGKSYQSINNTKAAMDCYQKVLQLHPQHKYAPKRIAALNLIKPKSIS